MIDYTKYRLKSDREVAALLEGVGRIWIVWCRKCYREFQPEAEDICHPILDAPGASGGKIAGCLGLDFLCNDRHTSRRLKEHGAGKHDAVGVVACGLGIQLTAERLEGKRVLALADSVPQAGNAVSGVGYHGIALEPEKCAACAQCYLNDTGGICPVVACAKSLLNGSCGGAKNGKCEVSPDTPCAWEEIFRRLSARGQTLSETVHRRNFEKFPYADRAARSTECTARREAGFPGGVYPLERKAETEHCAIQRFPDPAVAVLFLSQHTGSPARPVVKPGQRVDAGQMIAESTGLVSSSVHTGISGTVEAIEDRLHPTLGRPMPAVIVHNDGESRVHHSVQPLADWASRSAEDLCAFIQEKGIVGMGGAMFPTHVKLNPPRPVDTLVVNGCECEPLVSADNRIMVEYAAEVLRGADVARAILGVSRVVVSIEENKPEAIAAMEKQAGGFPATRIVPLQTKYPQGAEKVLITRLLKRRVPDGGLPMDVGVVVLNVSTCYALFQAVFEGRPLTGRVVTVAGDGMTGGNFLMTLGTPLADVSSRCAGTASMEARTVRMGGPMMGIVQNLASACTIKGTNGYVFLKPPPVSLSEERKCIQCGRCVDVCPADLFPLYYAEYGRRQDWAECDRRGVKNCIECGCCEYICSSKIALVSLIKKAKKCLSQK